MPYTIQCSGNTVKKHNYWTWNGDNISVPFSLAVASQVALQETFGTHQLISCLMLVYWRMLLSIQIVITVVLGVLHWETLHSTQPQLLTTLALLLVPGLVLSVMWTVVMDWIQQSLRESANTMDYGLVAPSSVVRHRCINALNICFQIHGGNLSDCATVCNVILVSWRLKLEHFVNIFRDIKCYHL